MSATSCLFSTYIFSLPLEKVSCLLDIFSSSLHICSAFASLSKIIIYFHLPQIFLLFYHLLPFTKFPHSILFLIYSYRSPSPALTAPQGVRFIGVDRCVSGHFPSRPSSNVLFYRHHKIIITRGCFGHG